MTKSVARKLGPKLSLLLLYIFFYFVVLIILVNFVGHVHFQVELNLNTILTHFQFLA